MKNLFNLCCLLFILCSTAVSAQEIKGETITVLKGGITVIRFASDVVNFRVGDKEDYNINVEEGTSIRIWAKNGVSNPKTTNLVVTEGKRNHLFTIEYKEKGDFNSTYYDFSNLKALKKKLNEKGDTDTKPQEVQEKPVEEEVVVKQTDKKKEKQEKAQAEKLAKEENDSRIAAERKKQEALEAQIAEEKRKQLELEEKIALEKKNREEKAQKLAEEKKAKEEKAAEDLAKKKREQQELKANQEKKLAENNARIAEEKRQKELQQKSLAEQQKEQATLNAKLAEEKRQREALEKKLAEEKFRNEQNEKALALETNKRKQKEEALAKEQAAREAKEAKLAEEKRKRELAEQKIVEEKKKKAEQDRLAQEELAKYVPPPAEIDIRKNFPNINFNEPPAGQYFDGMHFGDTMAYYKGAQAYLKQADNPKYKNAGTEIDQVRIELCSINFSGKAAYVKFKIDNKTNSYFILGATMLKILEAESGKKYQLNPYYISSFPIIEANSSAYVVYVMKPEQNISPDSFVMMSIRERQTNKKYELNFPGNFYTDALKEASK